RYAASTRRLREEQTETSPRLRPPMRAKEDPQVIAASKIKKYDGPSFACHKFVEGKPSMFIDDWVEDFENWFERQVGDSKKNGMGEHLIRILGLALVDASKTYKWYTRMINRWDGDWVHVKRDLSSAFMPAWEKDRRGTLRVFADCQQDQHENVCVYNVRFRECMEQFEKYKPEGKTLAHMEVFRAYYSGLKDKDLQDEVWKARKDRLSTLMEKAVLWEEELTERNRTRTSSNYEQDVSRSEGSVRSGDGLKATTPNGASERNSSEQETMDYLVKNFENL
ncbi:hypothetical protein BGW38_009721, partial [Lunasporangiospora selenospora]